MLVYISEQLDPKRLIFIPTSGLNFNTLVKFLNPVHS